MHTPMRKRRLFEQLTSEQIEMLEKVKNLPDEFIVSDEVCGLLLGGMSRWTVDRTNPVPPIQLSTRTRGRRLGDIRKLTRGELAPTAA
jgi:hypothetical protein